MSRTYANVNEALNNYFFSGRFGMLPIYLDLEGVAKNEIADALNIEPTDLTYVVGHCASSTLRFDKANPYFDQIKWLKDWSAAGRKKPPPFTALLVGFSIAAEMMGTDANFSPNNYYVRLFELFGVKDSGIQNRLKQNAKHTRQFWRALNLWLSENDFELGRPTARALIRHWRYASYALSQALVREGDRKRFGSLFETYDLVPGDPITEAEMTLLVHEWMSLHGSAGPNSWLRKLWSSNDLRERVILAALDAFDIWERSSNQVQNGLKKARLQWQLGFSGFPRKRARLSLAVNRSGQVEQLDSESKSDSFPSQVRLEDGFEMGVQFLGPIEKISLDLLLLQSATFIGRESGTNYQYFAKPIVVLAKASDSPIYQEVLRVSLFDEHIILCHEHWLQRVEEHLAQCARQGHIVLRASDMEGIPKGWYILRGVEVVRSLGNAHDSLYALTPICGSATVACVGGLKLSHGTWHVDWPPSVEASSEKRGCELEIAREHFGEDDEVIATDVATGDFMEAQLHGVADLAGSNLRAAVKTNATDLAEISFSLRSADIPRPLGEKRIFHRIGENGLFEINAYDICAVSQDCLEGCFFTGTPRVPEIGADMLPAAILDIAPEGIPESSQDADWYHTPDAVQAAQESCVIRGYHYWTLQPFQKGDDRFEAKIGECKDCHIRALFGSRAPNRRRRTHPEEQATERQTRSYLDRRVQIQASQTGYGAASLDTIFDGLCYLGEGGWGSFKRLASGASQEKWFSQSLASDLFALGNLETRYALFSPSLEWSVPPPVLVIGRDTCGRLAGFHSKCLIDRIDSALSRYGGRYDPVSLPDQVTVHRWSGLDGLDTETLLQDVSDPHGRPLTVAQNLDMFIASSLPNLELAWLEGKPIYIERSEDLEMFDVQRARWIRDCGAEKVGAYRAGLYGTRYFFRDVKGNTRQVSHQIAKILAARAEGIRLHGYDIQSGRFTAPLGAEPPWLYGRALVASSGALPSIEGGRLVYENVDSQVAAMVLSKLYEGVNDGG